MTPSRKILITAVVPGTIRSFLMPVLDALERDEWEIHGMADGISQDPVLVNRLKAVWDIGFSRSLSGTALHLPRTLRAIRELLRRERYDIVHTHTPISSFVLRLAVATIPASERPSVIYTAHGLYFHDQGSAPANAVFFAAEKVAGLWTDRLVVINEEDHERATRSGVVPASRIELIPGIGVDAAALDPGRIEDPDVEETRRELGFSEEEHIILMAAEFIPRKRHEDMIEAMRLLERDDVILCFAGSGRAEEPMRAKVKELGLESKIKFLGFRRDLPLLMRLADAVVLPSLLEGLPRCMLEAMCLEIPVIASDIRGNRELLRCGCGVSVPPRAPRQLADAVNWVIEHPVEAAEMGTRGRSAVLARYDDRMVLPRQMEIINACLVEKRRRLAGDGADVAA